MIQHDFSAILHGTETPLYAELRVLSYTRIAPCQRHRQQKSNVKSEFRILDLEQL